MALLALVICCTRIYGTRALVVAGVRKVPPAAAKPQANGAAPAAPGAPGEHQAGDLAGDLAEPAAPWFGAVMPPPEGHTH